eukprot:2140045-Rhodomonas_salina.2
MKLCWKLRGLPPLEQSRSSPWGRNRKRVADSSVRGTARRVDGRRRTGTKTALLRLRCGVATS